MTPFPATPRDVAALTLQEFTFRLDLDHSPSLPDVCDRFGEDTNRAVVWLVRFRALQKLKAEGRMDRWIRTGPRRIDNRSAATSSKLPRRSR